MQFPIAAPKKIQLAAKDTPSSLRIILKICKVKLLVESFLRRLNICGFETNNYDTIKIFNLSETSRARACGSGSGIKS